MSEINESNTPAHSQNLNSAVIGVTGYIAPAIRFWRDWQFQRAAGYLSELHPSKSSLEEDT
jgi:hypothetical protein